MWSNSSGTTSKSHAIGGQEKEPQTARLPAKQGRHPVDEGSSLPPVALSGSLTDRSHYRKEGASHHPGHAKAHDESHHEHLPRMGSKGKVAALTACAQMSGVTLWAREHQPDQSQDYQSREEFGDSHVPPRRRSGASEHCCQDDSADALRCDEVEVPASSSKGARCKNACRSGDWQAPETAALVERSAVWNPLQWLEVRQAMIEEGRLKQLPLLMHSIRKSTKRAMQLQSYNTETGTYVDLSKHLLPAESIRWLGRRNIHVPPMPSPGPKEKVEPPIVVVDLSPLDVVSALRTAGQEVTQPICVVVEISDFDVDGSVNVDSVNSGQQNMLMRTDFSRFARAASTSVRNAHCSVRDHLTAQHDPYVFTCPDISMFRGAREDGFPFLDKPAHVSCVAYAMPCLRPAVTMTKRTGTTEKTSWYASDLDQTALLERLSLIGFAALQGLGSDTKGILIMGAPGCMDRGLHPRDAVANSLRHWRTRFSRLFHTVILACGSDKDMAERIDVAINRQVYAALVQEDTSHFADWHWQGSIIALHINFSDFNEIANMYLEDKDRREIEDLDVDEAAFEQPIVGADLELGEADDVANKDGAQSDLLSKSAGLQEESESDLWQGDHPVGGGSEQATPHEKHPLSTAHELDHPINNSRKSVALNENSMMDMFGEAILENKSSTMHGDDAEEQVDTMFRLARDMKRKSDHHSQVPRTQSIVSMSTISASSGHFASSGPLARATLTCESLVHRTLSNRASHTRIQEGDGDSDDSGKGLKLMSASRRESNASNGSARTHRSARSRRSTAAKSERGLGAMSRAEAVNKMAHMVQPKLCSSKSTGQPSNHSFDVSEAEKLRAATRKRLSEHHKKFEGEEPTSERKSRFRILEDAKEPDEGDNVKLTTVRLPGTGGPLPRMDEDNEDEIQNVADDRSICGTVIEEHDAFTEAEDDGLTASSIEFSGPAEVEQAGESGGDLEAAHGSSLPSLPPLARQSSTAPSKQDLDSRLDLQQLASAIRDKSDIYWSLPRTKRHKNMKLAALTRSKSRRTSNQARITENVKSLESSFMADKGINMAEQETIKLGDTVEALSVNQSFRNRNSYRQHKASSRFPSNGADEEGAVDELPSLPPLDKSDVGKMLASKARRFSNLSVSSKMTHLGQGAAAPQGNLDSHLLNKGRYKQLATEESDKSPTLRSPRQMRNSMCVSSRMSKLDALTDIGEHNFALL